MKKIIALILIILLSFALLACQTEVLPDNGSLQEEYQEEEVEEVEEIEEESKIEKTEDELEEDETTSPKEEVVKEEPAKDLEISNKYIISFSIEGPDSILYQNESYEMEGDSMIALNILTAIADKEDLRIDLMGSGRTAYLKGINDYYEFDYGPLSGWMIQLNGEIPQRSIGVLEINQGDNVRLRYTKELGNDFYD